MQGKCATLLFQNRNVPYVERNSFSNHTERRNINETALFQENPLVFQAKAPPKP